MGSVFLSPGLKVREVPPRVRTIQGVPTSIGGLVGISERGPIGEAKLVTTLEDFIQNYGGPIDEGFLYWSAKGFFDQAGEGAQLYVTRTAHYTDITDVNTLTAVASSGTVQDTGGTPQDTLTINALTEGTYGNQIQYTIENATRFSTTINQAAGLQNGDTSVLLTSTSGVRKGTVLFFDDGVDSITKVVDRTENQRAYFDTPVAGLAAAVDDGGTVTEVSFTIRVYESDFEVEVFDFVSMEDTNAADYVETRINGNSLYISVVDEDSTNGPGIDRPAPVTTPTFLTGGDNGLTGLLDTDLVGNAGTKTGLYAFDRVKFINMVSIPESQSNVSQLGVIDYCEGRDFVVGILNSPLGLDEQSVVSHVVTTLAANTSHSAFYYKQLLVADPINGGDKIIPAEGHIQGIWARVDANFGLAQAPAGELAQVRGIIGFENDNAQSQGERDLIYPERINPLIQSDNLGRVLFGSRTLDRTNGIGAQINERRVFNFIGQSLINGLEFILFKNNTPDVRATVRDTITAFLVIQKQFGIIEDFYVDVGEGLNNALVRATGRLVAAVGIKVPDTIEFVEILMTRDTRAQEAALEELAAA